MGSLRARGEGDERIFEVCPGDLEVIECDATLEEGSQDRLGLVREQSDVAARDLDVLYWQAGECPFVGRRRESDRLPGDLAL
jgi:hypothetical protein